MTKKTKNQTQKTEVEEPSRTAQDYEKELREMVQERTGKPMPLWLLPQARATAANMVILDKIQAEIIKSQTLVIPVMGSTGQIKNEVSPLLPHFDKTQRTLMMQLEALGLNFSTPTSKFADDQNKDKDDKKKALAKLLADASDNMNEIPEY